MRKETVKMLLLKNKIMIRLAENKARRDYAKMSVAIDRYHSCFRYLNKLQVDNKKLNRELKSYE